MRRDPGSTSNSFTVEIVDDSGLPVTSLVAATFPAVSYQRLNAAAVSVTLSDLVAIGSTFSAGGVFEIGNGRYRLDIADAAFATATNQLSIVGEASGKRLICPPIEVRYESANAVQIGGSSTAAKIAGLLYGSAVADGTVATVTDSGHFTISSTDDTLSASDNTYNNLLLVFTSGNNQFVPREISVYTGATKAVAFTGTGFKGTFPNTVQVGDSFLILSGGP